jgi:hypothetical protein
MALAVSTDSLLAGFTKNWDGILWRNVDMEEIGKVALGLLALQALGYLLLP